MSQQQPQPQPQQSEQSQEGMDIQMRETFGSGRKCLHEFLKGRAVLKQKYQHYDSAIMDQRKNRPKLKLDDFHLLRTLGTGSFGRVHLAQSRHNGRYYAIKVLKKTEVVRLKQVEHTNNEKHILEAVANPFLVNLWGTFQDDANLYMVMDYVPGGELFSVLRKSKVSTPYCGIVEAGRFTFHMHSASLIMSLNFTLLKWHWPSSIFTKRMWFIAI